MREMTIVRDNLINEINYSPYCGNDNCRLMPRTVFIDKQFVCPHCAWRSDFPKDFIIRYKRKWNIK